jgi:hypothetical protein
VTGNCSQYGGDEGKSKKKAAHKPIFHQLVWQPSFLFFYYIIKKEM